MLQRCQHYNPASEGHDFCSEPQLSPDGTHAAYTVAVPDLQANRLARNIGLVSLRGGDAKPLTTTGRDGGARNAAGRALLRGPFAVRLV